MPCTDRSNPNVLLSQATLQAEGCLWLSFKSFVTQVFPRQRVAYSSRPGVILLIRSQAFSRTQTRYAPLNAFVSSFLIVLGIPRM